MTYNELLSRKDRDNHYYEVVCAFTRKTFWRGMNYYETIEFCKGRENRVFIYIC